MNALLTPAEAPPTAPLDATLRLFHAAVPMASGVVLASLDGVVLAHDLPAHADAHAATGEAARERMAVLATSRASPASAFVQTPAGLALVVFMAG